MNEIFFFYRQQCSCFIFFIPFSQSFCPRSDDDFKDQSYQIVHLMGQNYWNTVKGIYGRAEIPDESAIVDEKNKNS